jgi:hypothetical protein
MSSWGNNDNAANAPYWAVNSTIAPDNPSRARPTADNVALLYGNTTPDVYTTDETIGLFLVDAAEEQVRESGALKPAHSGWNIYKVGSGGRAGRQTFETLVALANVTTDNNSDDGLLPDAVITLTQPATVRGPVSAASAANVTYSVVGTTVVPEGATLTYVWQGNNNAGGSWTTITNGNKNGAAFPPNTIISGATTATLTVDPTNVDANNYVFRAIVTATNPGITNSTTTATSANGRILITA